MPKAKKRQPKTETKKSHECGRCAKCSSIDIDYGMSFPDGDMMMYYEMTCNECGWTGKEWYSMDFIEVTSDEE
jgi:hypothetical protein